MISDAFLASQHRDPQARMSGARSFSRPAFTVSPAKADRIMGAVAIMVGVAFVIALAAGVLPRAASPTGSSADAPITRARVPARS